MTVTSQQLESLWEGLNGRTFERRYDVDDLVKRIVEDGWAMQSDIDDLLYSMDSRLHHKGGIAPDVLSEQLKLPWRSVYWMPDKRQRRSAGFLALAAADVFELLCAYERLGFDVDPSTLREALLPRIKALQKITDSELAVVWYDATRAKSEPLVLTVDGHHPFHEDLSVLKLATGYRAELRRNRDGLATSLTVHAPKYRRPAEPVRTDCSECGYTYYKGDPASSHDHRREHRDRMRILRPSANSRMVKALAFDNEPELVTASSPEWMHREMYGRARAFKREMRFDFTQWDMKRDADPHAHGFLFASPQGVILGAAAFRLRRNDDETWWGLQWVWVCPEARRSGLLRARWRYFRERFGDFHIEGPASDAMVAFAKAAGDEALLG